MKTLPQFIKENRIRITNEEIGERPDGLMSNTPRGSTHWKVVLQKNRKQITIYFSQGSAHYDEPDVCDVMSCLISDAQLAESCQDAADVMTLLHLLGGQRYERVVFLQILVLAWIPVLIYLITKALHNRMSGVIAAILVIIRETNSIWLTERITTSHVKLLMADLPTTLVTVLFFLLGVIWLQNIPGRKLVAIASGGALGLAMLVRPEVLVFTFPLLLISGLILWKGRQWRLWLQSCLLFGLGLALVILPWVWRNYSK